ncbi:MAG: hypothetical protein V5B34_02450 [Accumulibacter sp.]
MKVAMVSEGGVSLEASHVEDIWLASSKMTGSERRAFQAEMAVKSVAAALGAQRRFSAGVGRLFGLV